MEACNHKFKYLCREAYELVPGASMLGKAKSKVTQVYQSGTATGNDNHRPPATPSGSLG